VIIVILKRFALFLNMKKINVIKFNGEEEAFSSRKIYNSAKRSGASNDLAHKIMTELEKQAYSGIKTSDIYEEVRKRLREENSRAGLRYNLKKALKELGPSGFPFEKYIGEVFTHLGYKVKINQFLAGKCCTHEIDFVVEKDGLIYIGECKYRNLLGGIVHSKDALANYARFLDIKERSEMKSIMVTNSRFTSRAIKYCNCVGVDVLGWKIPKRGLEYIIENNKLYPITILNSLNRDLAKIFVDKGIMLIKDLLDRDINDLSRITNISQKKLKPLITEASLLLS